mmetsp:Transcript_45862/g.109207  ORF Transcript_45862/g.109207 Transcript_45862/m.109207 type:complete len:183 (-) Transcript_45862:164-712(-)
MKFSSTLQLLICAATCLVPQAVELLRQRRGVSTSTPTAGDPFVLRQYSNQFCGAESPYTLIELQYNYMTQLTTHSGMVVCNKVAMNETDGTYVVDSCPVGPSGCPATCQDCLEDMVKHFSLGECEGGWLLVQGAATEECGPEHLCRGKNVVDVGLARWCDQWPVLGAEAKTSDELLSDSTAE